MFGTMARDPFREMRRLTREMDRLAAQGTGQGSGAGAGFPAMNVYTGQDGVAITAEVPGMTKEDLEISVHRDTVTVKGERKGKIEGATAYHRRERGTGRFNRTLSLPFAVDPEQVEASLSGGILHLSLRRPESDKPRRIDVRTG